MSLFIRRRRVHSRTAIKLQSQDCNAEHGTDRARGCLEKERLERSGMEQKIEELIGTYGNLLWRTGIMMLGEPQDVQDMIQEVLLKYLQKEPVFRDAEHEKAWLLRVMINLCKDMLRFRKRHLYSPIDELEPEAARGPDAESRALLETIAALPQKWKAVLLLHYIEGYSLKEIAEILGVSENAVKKRMQRAKEALRKKMEE